MESTPNREQRFATFHLGGDRPIEVAINAQEVLEATPVTGTIQPLPTSVAHVEGFMHLRDDAIPVINMKRRLGLSDSDYSPDAKVAVVAIDQFRMGLLFDDIKDVLVVADAMIEPVHPAFQNDDGLISDVIKLQRGARTIEVLDLKRLLDAGGVAEQIRAADARMKSVEASVQQTYSRFVVFSSSGQDYGVPVERVQEITFLTEIDDVFKSKRVDGAIELRGQSVPILDATRILKVQPFKNCPSVNP